MLRARCTNIVIVKDCQRAVADQLQHVAAGRVDGLYHNLGIIVEQWNYLIRRRRVSDPRIATQIAKLEHGTDSFRAAAFDPTAQDPASRIAAEIGLDECRRDTRQRSALQGCGKWTNQPL